MRAMSSSPQRYCGRASSAASSRPIVGSALAAGCKGWHRLQGRKPASMHSPMVAWKVQFPASGLRAGQVSRQNTPVEATQT